MAQINVSHLTFCYEGSFENIFEDVSISVDTDWKLGLLGRNGKGKTTFLRLLQGKYPYRGTISTQTVFDYFPYPVSEGQMLMPAAEFMEELKPGCEAWRVICELELLGQEAEILYRPFGGLSPGEQTKILLAILFSGENDFLLIDEPTNHLDQTSRETVKRYLASKRGFILVSHDRDLLDFCVNHVLVLNRRSIELQSGNFSTWQENKQRRDQFEQAENEKHLREIGKLRQAAARTAAWADKNEGTKIGFDPIAEHDRSKDTRAFLGAKTKKMQSRVKQMERRIHREIEEKEGLLADLEQPAELKLLPLRHHRETLVNIREYAAKYKNAREPLFTGLTFSVSRGQRIALHGSNGCGKSTLLKMILWKAGVIQEPLPIGETGICETASGLVISYVSQDTSMLRGSISDFCAERELKESLFCAILRQLDMERTQFQKGMEEYSEGQKKKVLIAASLLTPAHLYIWDEPLNYVDVFSRMQIEKLILDYGPTMLFVEHDARFREKIATGTVKLS
ncbi:MAG: ATP-binding cassette domain-containing protein [bacterium]|nr:ATP-binding cassette domain-containing protein [bacterium]MCM1375541.1 ATP-binding cassette domain-containing protein [Muribaculum sp.]